jgi:galactokinase
MYSKTALGGRFSVHTAAGKQQEDSVGEENGGGAMKCAEELLSLYNNSITTRMKAKIQAKFKELFGKEGQLYMSSGRINLIGEHTDYNGGYVFPGAINFGIMAAIEPNGTDKVKLFSIDFDEYVEFGLKEEDKPAQQWARYVFGVCRETLKRGGKVQGFNAVFAGDVPLGAGLSSSAALESVFAYALNEINGNHIEKFELAKIGQSTEHNYCGVKCGIMDQFASIFGKEGSLIRLNCKTGEYKYFPFNPVGYKVVLIDSCVKHELASSAYNKRRESCENAAAAIRKNHPEVEFLSDAKRLWLDEVRAEIPQEDFLRAEYVIGELQRVLDVCDALERGDYETVGEMMYQTHFGLSKLYEVSCEELDYLNKLARKMDVTGSRVMGGGFGGCTINLVKEELYEPFIEAAKKGFEEKFGHAPKIYDVVISDGARKLQ